MRREKTSTDAENNESLLSLYTEEEKKEYMNDYAERYIQIN
jgi:hypothetical protein